MPKPGRQGLAAAALESVNEVAAAEFAAKPFLKAADAQIIPSPLTRSAFSLADSWQRA
jgi:hypothetical protein